MEFRRSQAFKARYTFRRSLMSTTAKSASLCAASSVSLEAWLWRSRSKRVKMCRLYWHVFRMFLSQLGQLGFTQFTALMRDSNVNSGQETFKNNAEITRISAKTITCQGKATQSVCHRIFLLRSLKKQKESIRKHQKDRSFAKRKD